MPSINGHGPKRAIIYVRVSGDEQAKKGYSLPDQADALRKWAESEGYEVLEEVADEGWSGAYLEQPGLDRLRDLVQEGGVSAVAVLFRDRLAWGVYAQLLKEEFAKHGTRLVTLNTLLDDSPEGELQGGILDQFAAYERAKIAERTRRGKLRKAREGKVVATNRPHYGFEYNTARDNYVVVKGEMGIVERIFRMVGAEKASMHAVKRTFENEGIPSPNGKRHWGKFFIRECIKDDAYRPHTREEIEAFVRRGQMSPEVASRLDPEERYGIWWFNRHRTVTTQVAEQGTNGKRYRRRTKYTPSPKRNG